MINPIFPLVQISIDNVEPKKLAGDKALAAHTFCSKNVDVEYLESKIWQRFNGNFGQQYISSKTPQININSEKYKWVAFPYSVSNTSNIRVFSIVWNDSNTQARYIRHIRVFNSVDVAKEFNENIEYIFHQNQ